MLAGAEPLLLRYRALIATGANSRVKLLSKNLDNTSPSAIHMRSRADKSQTVLRLHKWRTGSLQHQWFPQKEYILPCLHLSLIPNGQARFSMQRIEKERMRNLNFGRWTKETLQSVEKMFQYFSTLPNNYTICHAFAIPYSVYFTWFHFTLTQEQ